MSIAVTILIIITAIGMIIVAALIIAIPLTSSNTPSQPSSTQNTSLIPPPVTITGTVATNNPPINNNLTSAPVNQSQTGFGMVGTNLTNSYLMQNNMNNPYLLQNNSANNMVNNPFLPDFNPLKSTANSYPFQYNVVGDCPSPAPSISACIASCPCILQSILSMQNTNDIISMINQLKTMTNNNTPPEPTQLQDLILDNPQNIQTINNQTMDQLPTDTITINNPSIKDNMSLNGPITDNNTVYIRNTDNANNITNQGDIIVPSMVCKSIGSVNDQTNTIGSLNNIVISTNPALFPAYESSLSQEPDTVPVQIKKLSKRQKKNRKRKNKNL